MIASSHVRRSAWTMLLFLAFIALATSGCTPTNSGTSTTVEATVTKSYNAPPEMQIDPQKRYQAVIHTTEGDLTADLFANEAPKTVNNFVFLVREGYYANVKFHRIIKGFMVQTGDPTGTGRGGPGYRFEDEPVRRSYVRGTLAMANAGPNTNGSQFFIVHQDYPLPPNYTIFGQVVDGLETLDRIADTPVTMGSTDRVPSVPTTDVRITSIDITEQ